MRQRQEPLSSRPEIDWDGLIRFIQSLRKRDEWEAKQRVGQAPQAEQHIKREPAVEVAPGALLLTQKQVCEMVGLTRSTIYQLRCDGRFPEPVHLNPGQRTGIRWHRAEALAWVNERQRQR